MLKNGTARMQMIFFTCSNVAERSLSFICAMFIVEHK
jgi:hypothetical protein